MAKIASQNIIIQISKAVSNSASSEITLLDNDIIQQLQETIEALISDNNVVVELISDDA